MQKNGIADKNKIGWFKDIAIISLLFAVIYIGFLWVRPLASPDEGRYSQIPIEMVKSGNYVSPTLNDMPYFYKPPLFYWLQCASIKTFGVNKFSLRLANTLMALLGIAITYCAGRALYGRSAGVMSAIVLGIGVLYFALGQIITLDMTVSVFISASMFSFIVALKKSGIWRGLLILLFFVLSALAVMSKGIIGVLIPSVVISLYAFALGVVPFFKKLKFSDIYWIIAGLVLFCAIAVPWHVLASLQNPALENAEGIFSKKWDGQGFFWYYFVHEHFLRFVDSSTSMREEPWWYFLALAPIGFCPCLVFLPQAIKDIFKGGWKNLCEKNSEMIFFLLWIIFVVAFFSISSSKLAPYILPIYPALSVIVGAWLAKVWGSGDFSKLKIAQFLMLCLGYVAVFAPWLVWYILNRKGKLMEESDDMAIGTAILSVLMLCGTVCSYIFARKGKPKQFWIGATITMGLFYIMFNCLAGFLQRESTEGIVEKIADVRKPDDIYMIAYEYNIFQDFPVWLGQTVYTIGAVPEEQKFGYMREGNENNARFIGDKAEFSQLAKNSTGNIYIIIRNRDIDKFNKEINVQYEIVERERNFNLLKVKK